MRKEDIEKVKILNALVKTGNIENVESYIRENNIKIDQYFYIMSAMRNKGMLEFLLLNMSKITFRARSKRKILDKMLDYGYYKEFLFFLDKTKYEKYFENESKLAQRVVRTNNNYLITEFFKRYKKYYYLLSDSYELLIKNKRYDLLIVDERKQYKFIASFLKQNLEMDKIIEKNLISFKDFSVKKVFELYYEMKNYNIKDYRALNIILNNKKVKELLFKISMKKNNKIEKNLERYYLEVELSNF